MAYKKSELYQKAMTAIKEHNLFFVDDIVAYIGISKPTFYLKFPPESNELNAIKRELETNRIRTKSSLRSKLFNSLQTGQLLALYRLICTPEERQMLNQNFIDVTTGGEKMKQEITVEVIDRREQVDRPDDED